MYDNVIARDSEYFGPISLININRTASTKIIAVIDVFAHANGDTDGTANVENAPDRNRIVHA